MLVHVPEDLLDDHIERRIQQTGCHLFVVEIYSDLSVIDHGGCGKKTALAKAC
jgi:hypothetical protein